MALPNIPASSSIQEQIQKHKTYKMTQNAEKVTHTHIIKRTPHTNDTELEL